MITAAQAQTILTSGDCACGGRKRPGRAFCTECSSRLTPALKREVNRPVGYGFEAQYELALDHIATIRRLESK